jgi:hypothetical protein
MARFYWLLLLATGATVAQGADHRLTLRAEAVGAQLLVAPYLDSKRPAILRYELVAVKLGPSGATRSAQSGTVRAACCEPRALSSLHLSLGPEDSYSIRARLYEEGILVAEQVVRHPE